MNFVKFVIGFVIGFIFIEIVQRRHRRLLARGSKVSQRKQGK